MAATHPVEISVDVSCDMGEFAVAVSSDCTPSFKGLLIISCKAVKSFQMNIIHVEKREGGISWLGLRRFHAPSSLTCGYTSLFPRFVETLRLLYGDLRNREIATGGILSQKTEARIEIQHTSVSPGSLRF